MYQHLFQSTGCLGELIIVGNVCLAYILFMTFKACTFLVNKKNHQTNSILVLQFVAFVR